MGLKLLQFLSICELCGRNFFSSSFLLSFYDLPNLTHALAQVLLVSPQIIFQHGEKRDASSFSEVVLVVHLVSTFSCFRGNFGCSLLLFLRCWGSLLHPTYLLSSNKDQPTLNLIKLPLVPLWKTPVCPHYMSCKRERQFHS